MAETPIDTDRLFFALSDKTRRLLLGQLALRPMTVTELARAADISVAAAVQHLDILQETGLAATEKVGRVRTCQIDRRGFDALERWIRNHHTLWELRLDSLSEMLGNTGKDAPSTDG
ncbi:ArsR/SmtB family transcription factor [Terracidiphilus gabretensis]|jgi:DNA-binding transcriptional ArsR family regulator|uniref:ArsR/SmtB family transcription factor n=1 Tax=Terracidiphilus gabretensis TaxID=1577687 RepID=UPI00071B0DC0|nr:helix-turn-helix domain-containing protein [Terracidiphilus gabretensis]